MTENNRNIKNGIPGCTVAFAVGKASESGETLVLKNGDIDSHWYMQMFLSRKGSSDGGFYSGPLGYLSGKKKHSFIGQRCLSYWAPHMGINDAEVSISLLASKGREDNKKEGLLGGFDYNRIVLDFADTARNGIEILGEAIERFGFADISMSYIIGDPEEVWLLEASGFQWAAKRYRDAAGSHANHYIIETDWDLSSSGMVDYAVKKGWIEEEETLNFREVYSGSGYLNKEAPPRPDVFSSTVRQQRADELLRRQLEKGPVSKQVLMDIARDQMDDYELKNGKKLNFNQTPWHSTEFYRNDFGGGEWLDDYPEADYLKSPVFIRQICCDTVYEKTLGSAIFVSGGKSAAKGLMFALIGVPTFSAFVPFFAEMSKMHPAFAGIEAAKLFESIDLQAFGKYQEFHPISSSILEPLEAEIMSDADSFRGSIVSRPETEALDTFSHGCAEKLIEAGNQILEKFRLYELRLRSWGRKRENTDRVPDIYTVVDSNAAIGTGGKSAGNAERPLAVRKDGVIHIDRVCLGGCFSGKSEGQPDDVNAYIPIEQAADEFGFEWEDLPETGDLLIYKK